MEAVSSVSFLFRFLLFVSSYFPAFLILFILLLGSFPWLAWTALGVGLVGLAALAVVLRYLSRQVPRELVVKKCRRQDTEAMTYILSYVVPFLSGMLEGRDSALAFTVFFLVLGVLYANSNLIHINPMLNLACYQIYQVEFEAEVPVILISRGRAVPGSKVRVASAGEDIFLRTG